MQTKQEEKNQYSEEEVVNYLEKILKEQAEPILVMKLGHIIDFQIRNFMFEKFGGLLSFLLKYPKIFSVTEDRPKCFVFLTEIPQPYYPVSLTKKMKLLTSYKTIPCSHFASNLQCQLKECKFSHGDTERRRNPFSPFFESYGPHLVEKDPARHASTKCINQTEFLYHPENYQTEFCRSVSTRTRCKEYSICSYAHHGDEYTFPDPGNSLGYLARYQQWDELIARLAKLLAAGGNFDTLVKTEVYKFSRETFLHYLAKYNQWSIFEFIKNKFRVELNPTILAIRDLFGQTMLMKACAFPGTNEHGQLSEDYIQMIRFLIIANTNAALFKDKDGHDIFFFAQKQIRLTSVGRERLKSLLKVTLVNALGTLPKIAEIDDSPLPELDGYSLKNIQAPALPANPPVIYQPYQPFHLREKMELLTSYKTIPCSHFASNLQCQLKKCKFSHGDTERRRNPFSPFFESYGPHLVEKDPARHASTKCINQTEFLYHPENYQTEFCRSVSTRTRCKEYPVCSYAHNGLEYTLADPGNSLGYLARYQQWDQLITKLATKLLAEGEDFDTLVRTEVYKFSGETFLHYMAKYSQWTIFELIKNEFRVELNPTILAIRDLFGQTMLMKACAFPGTNEHGQLSKDYIQMIRFLILANKDAALFKDRDWHGIFFFAQKQIRLTSVVRESLKQLLKATLVEAFGTLPKIVEIDDSLPELDGYSLENIQAPALPANPSVISIISPAAPINPSVTAAISPVSPANSSVTSAISPVSPANSSVTSPVSLVSPANPPELYQPYQPFHLRKKMEILTSYKTIPCSHFASNLQCQFKECKFSHGDTERRRNPFSPFFESYGPHLVEKDPARHASTKCINQTEFLYHPENYQTQFCRSFGTQTRCKEYSCRYAHNSLEYTLADPGNSLGYLARYQQWGQLIAKLAKLLEEGGNFDTLVKTEVYKFSRETFLHYMAKYSQWPIFEHIKNEFRVELNPTILAIRDLFGQTMLMKACAFPGTNEHGQLSKDYIQIIRFLILANKEAALFKDKDGHDIFFFAQKQIRLTSVVRESLKQLLKATLVEAFGTLPKIAEIDDSPLPELDGYSLENIQAPALPANPSVISIISPAAPINPSVTAAISPVSPANSSVTAAISPVSPANSSVTSPVSLVSPANPPVFSLRSYVSFFQSLVSNPVETLNQLSNSSLNQTAAPQSKPEMLATTATTCQQSTAPQELVLVPLNQADYSCPITWELFQDPVLLQISGKSYERSAIVKALLNNPICPLTRYRVTIKAKRPNTGNEEDDIACWGIMLQVEGVIKPNYYLKEICEEIRKAVAAQKGVAKQNTTL
jgi:U-box domain